MRLFHYPHAPYSRKVLLAAYERGVAFESVVCPPFDKAAKVELKKVHPLATVPLLVDGTDVYTESSIIAEVFDLAGKEGPPLLPADPRAALRMRALDRLSDAHLMAPAAYLVWATRKTEGALNHDKIAAQRVELETALGLLDRELTSGELVAGSSFSFADLSPAATLSCALTDRTLDDLSRWPSVASWYARVVARPSFVRILEECRSVPLPPDLAR